MSFFEPRPYPPYTGNDNCERWQSREEGETPPKYGPPCIRIFEDVFAPLLVKDVNAFMARDDINLLGVSASAPGPSASGESPGQITSAHVVTILYQERLP